MMKGLQKRTEQGFVLVIALIVLGAMALAAVTLARTVDVSTLLSRNIAFKRDAISRNDIGLEVVLDKIRTGTFSFTSNSLYADDLTKNYSSTMRVTNSYGIPTDLIGGWGSAGAISIATVSGSAIPADFQLQVTYMIERMCSVTGADTAANCMRTGPEELGGSYRRAGGVQVPNPPLLRVSTKVSSSTLVGIESYGQAIIGAQTQRSN